MNSINDPFRGGIDEEQIKQLELKIDHLGSSFDKTKSDLADSMHYLKEHMAQKVSLLKLEETEDRLQLLLDKIVVNCNKRFVEKKDVKKSIGILD